MPCQVLHTQSRHRDGRCVCERLLQQEQLEKPFREVFTGVQGGNGPVLPLVSDLTPGCPPAQGTGPLDSKDICHRLVPCDTEVQLAQLEQRGRWHSLGTRPGWKAGYSCTLFHSSLSSCPSHKPDPRKNPIQFPAPDKLCRLTLEDVSYFWKHPLEHFPLKALVYP